MNRRNGINGKNGKNGKRKQKIKNEIQQEIELYDASRSKEKENILHILKNLKFTSGFRAKNKKQKKLLQLIHENEIIFVAGPAGTGKTIISLKASLELLRDESSPIEKILIAKPIIEAAESLGFLPGDIDSKIEPFMSSYDINFNKLTNPELIKKLFNHGTIEAKPLAHMRGETFVNTVAILDEAQNTTKLGLKLFLTRKDENSKIIVVGDLDQSDLKLKNGQKNALQEAFDIFQNIKGIVFLKFEEDDIIRSKILIDILKRYKN